MCSVFAVVHSSICLSWISELVMVSPNSRLYIFCTILISKLSCLPPLVFVFHWLIHWSLSVTLAHSLFFSLLSFSICLSFHLCVDAFLHVTMVSLLASYHLTETLSSYITWLPHFVSERSCKVHDGLATNDNFCKSSAGSLRMQSSTDCWKRRQTTDWGENDQHPLI